MVNTRALSTAGVPRATFDLIGLQASQIDGCVACLDRHTRATKKAGETDERLRTMAGWRDPSYFSDPERAGLALTEAGARLADRTGPIPDAGHRGHHRSRVDGRQVVVGEGEEGASRW